jgi:hypothetical protein
VKRSASACQSSVFLRQSRRHPRRLPESAASMTVRGGVWAQRLPEASWHAKAQEWRWRTGRVVSFELVSDRRLADSFGHPVSIPGSRPRPLCGCRGQCMGRRRVRRAGMAAMSPLRSWLAHLAVRPRSVAITGATNAALSTLSTQRVPVRASTARTRSLSAQMNATARAETRSGFADRDEN